MKLMIDVDTVATREQVAENIGWFVADKAHNNIKVRGPYRHAEAAGAVRAELERRATNEQNERMNLWVQWCGE